MKIIKLTAENFMRLVAVEISPKGNAILITGKNGQGKSSILDAIMAVFCGKKYHPEEPIRKGQDHAEVIVETENYIIKRTFTATGGGSVTVMNADGMKASSAQGLLDKLVGEIAFEPMAFYKDCRDLKKRREQVAMLMKLVGLDFTDIDADIAKVKQERSTVKSAKDTYDFEAGQIEVPDDTPDEEVSMLELTAKLTVATKHNDKQVEVSKQIDADKGGIERFKEGMESSKETIANIEKQLEGLKIGLENDEKTLETLKAKQEKLAESLEPLIDVATISKEIEDADSVNEKIRKKDRQTELYIKSAEKSKEFAALGKKLKALDAKKAERLAKAKMPIKGLSVNEDTILYNDGKQGDTPLAQVNESMQLQIAVAISMALNPKLKVILLNGNDLDSESLEIVCKMAEAKDYQVWIEKIDGCGKTGFVIEDGSVVVEADDTPKKKVDSVEVNSEPPKELTGDTAKDVGTDGELFTEKG